MEVGFTPVETAALFKVIAVDPEATAPDGVTRESCGVAVVF